MISNRSLRKGSGPWVPRWIAIAWMLAASLSSLHGDSNVSGPFISDVRTVGQELVVTVQVPAGKRRITVETSQRLSGGTWTPRIVQWSDGSAGKMVFHLALIDGMQMVRARDETDSDLGMPAAFFRGPTVFPSQWTSNFPGTYLGAVLLDAAAPGVPPPASSTPSGRTVVESDIWTLNGSTLYFFNQQRGLQVLDLSDVDHPRLTGTLPIAVNGEQLYRLPFQGPDGSTWLALLTQQDCTTDSQVMLVHVQDGLPVLTGVIPVQGQVRETRMVGSVLYLATSDWYTPSPPVYSADGAVVGTSDGPWENRTWLTAMDFSDPRMPGLPAPLEIAASSDAITATDRFLFMAVTGDATSTNSAPLAPWKIYGNHAVLLFDISDPHGAISQLGYVLTAGRVKDKFKIGFDGGTLTAISQVDAVKQWVPDIGDPDKGSVLFEPSQTVLETFSLNDPSTPVALGKLVLLTGEDLFATRFSGKRAYVVTYHQVDPLWIVSLADPTAPKVEGQVAIPGFSTYLQPLANDTRLLTLGVESEHTMVQMFDVTPGQPPALLSKAVLGVGWSWSEANSDEKAFQVFPEAGLALLPWQGQSSNPTNGWFEGIQLIDFDLTSGAVTPRGVIEHAWARRATLLEDHVVSVSSQDLISAVATNRDQPAITATVDLSREVDRILVNGGFLVQIRNGSPLPLRVSLATTQRPDKESAWVELENLPMVGAELRGNFLYLLQSKADDYVPVPTLVTNAVFRKFPYPPYLETNWVTETNMDWVRVPGHLTMSVLGVTTNPASLQILGSVTTENPINYNGQSWVARWPQEGLLVWAPPARSRPPVGIYWPLQGPVAGPGRIGVIDPVYGWGGGGYWGPSDRWLLAADVTQTSSPRFVSTTHLDGSSYWTDPADCFVAASKLYAGRVTTTYVAPGVQVTTNADGTITKGGYNPTELWRQDYYLDVVDFSVPSLPVVRSPVSLPGNLVGISHQGQMLYAEGMNPTDLSDANQYLHVLAYDGTQASLVASAVRPETTPKPLLVLEDGRILLGIPAATTNDVPTLQVWSVSSSGQWTKESRRELVNSAEEFHLYDNRLVVVGGDQYLYFDTHRLVPLNPLGTVHRLCSLWFDWSAADLSLDSGLWIPLGPNDLWNLPLR